MLRDDANGLFRRLEIADYTKKFVDEKRKQVKRFMKGEKFQTGWIQFPELKLGMNLLPNQLYRFEIAGDLFEREQEICDYYRQRNAVVHRADRSRLNGLCIPLTNLNLLEKCRANIVLVKAGLEEPTQTYVRGHENGHFLFNMGLRNQFYKQYSVPQRIQEKIIDTEDFAMFTGNIAMANAGYKLGDIKSVSSNWEILEKEKAARELVVEIIPEQFYDSLFRQRRI